MGFQGVDFIFQKDGVATRIAPVQYEARQQQARYIANKLRNEGNNEVEAYAAVKACNMASFRPMLPDEEVKSIVGSIFTTPLSFSKLDRNRRILELVKHFRKQNKQEDEVLRRIQLFNSRCCNPPLPDEDLTWIMENNAYMAENRSHFQVDKTLSKDGKTIIRIGETVDYKESRD